MTIWCKSKKEFLEITNTIMGQYSLLVEEHIRKERKINGYCIACEKIKTFELIPNADWPNLLEDLVCDCGINGRMRFILKVLDQILAFSEFNNALIFEKLTPLYNSIEQRIPNIIGCEFLGKDHSGGLVYEYANKNVRHENIMELTFESDSMDLVMHFDVIEHIPHPEKAIDEIYRVLMPGGIMLFSCPFYHNLEKNIVRASLNKNGEILHYMTPSYHGNPVSEGGSLVFFHPAWELINLLGASGFKDVAFAVDYSLPEGIFSNGCPFEDGHMWPVLFVVRK
jgi:SAM-dependent methyltransferase